MKLFKTLFVDDDINIHDITKILIDLGKLPFDSKYALSAEEGLTELSKSKSNFPDVIFVDINMPLMDGFEFLNNYQQEFLADYPDTLIFMFSSSMRSSDKEKAKNYPFVKEFISKPLESEVWDKLQAKYL